MNSLRHIFIVLLCLLVASSVAQAQNDWDSVLDRYEKIALQCMSLRDKAAAGERVSQKSVTELFGELNRLRTSLQQASGKMTAKQRERFRRVRESYDGKMDGQDGHSEKGRPATTGKEIIRSAQNDTSVILNEAAGEVKDLKSVPGASQGSTRPSFEPLPSAEGWPVRPAMTGKVQPAMPEILRSAQNASLLRNDTPVILNGAAGGVKDLTFNAIPTLSIGDTRQGGIFLSLYQGRFGGYLSARANFVSQLYAYECLSDGTTSGPEAFKGNGGQRIGEYSFSAGAVINAAPWLGAFAGAGYGSSTLCWSDFQGAWARVKDYSASGLQVEGGVVFHLRNLSLLGGVSWLTARPSSGPFMPVFTLGAGIRF